MVRGPSVAVRIALAAAVLAIAAVGCGVQSAFDLELGQCFDGGTTEQEVFTVTSKRCDEPHEKEVFVVFDYPNGPQEFPGEDAIDDVVYGRCVPEFRAFVGKDWEASQLDFWYLVPTEETWGNGDREIVCAVVDGSDQKLTGSMRGANR